MGSNRYWFGDSGMVRYSVVLIILSMGMLFLSGCTKNTPTYLECVEPPDWSNGSMCYDVNVLNPDGTVNFTYRACNITVSGYYPNGTPYTLDLVCNNMTETCVDDENNTFKLCPAPEFNPCVKENCIGLVCGKPGYTPSRPGDYCEGYLSNMSNSQNLVNSTLTSTLRQEPVLFYKTRCEFKPLDQKTVEEIQSSRGKMWVDRFRFGIGTSFEDYDEAQYYFPMSDRYTWLNPGGKVDRFVNYLGPRCVKRDDGRYDLVIGLDEVVESGLDEETCDERRMYHGGIQRLFCYNRTSGSASSGEEWVCPSPSGNETTFPTEYFASSSDARRACELFCSKVWETHIGDCISPTVHPPFLVNQSYVFTNEPIFGKDGSSSFTVDYLRSIDYEFYDKMLFSGYSYQLPERLDYECESGAECMSGYCSKDPDVGGHVSYRCVNESGGLLDCGCYMDPSIPGKVICYVPHVDGVRGVVSCYNATPCEVSGCSDCGDSSRPGTLSPKTEGDPRGTVLFASKEGSHLTTDIAFAGEPTGGELGDLCGPGNPCAPGYVCCDSYSCGPDVFGACKADEGTSCMYSSDCATPLGLTCVGGTCQASGGGGGGIPPRVPYENGTYCNDGVDNDGDGFTDCCDIGCWNSSFCHWERRCNVSDLEFGVSIWAKPVFPVDSTGESNYSLTMSYFYVNPDYIDDVWIIRECGASYEEEVICDGRCCEYQWINATRTGDWTELEECLEEHGIDPTTQWYEIPNTPYDDSGTGVYVPVRYKVTDWGVCNTTTYHGREIPYLRSFGWCMPATYLTIAVQEVKTTDPYCPEECEIKYNYPFGPSPSKYYISCDCSKTGPNFGPMIYNWDPGITPQPKYLYDHIIHYQKQGVLPLIIASDPGLYKGKICAIPYNGVGASSNCPEGLTELDTENSFPSCFYPGYDNSNCVVNSEGWGWSNDSEDELYFVLTPYIDPTLGKQQGSNILTTGTVLIDLGQYISSGPDRVSLERRMRAVKRFCPSCLIGFSADSCGTWVMRRWGSLCSHRELDGIMDHSTFIKDNTDFLITRVHYTIDPTKNQTEEARVMIKGMLNISNYHLKTYNKPTLFYLKFEQPVAVHTSSRTGKFGFTTNSHELGDTPSFTYSDTTEFTHQIGDVVCGRDPDFNWFWVNYDGSGYYQNDTLHWCTNISSHTLHYMIWGHDIRDQFDITSTDDSTVMEFQTFMYDWDSESEVKFTEIDRDDCGAIFVNGQVVWKDEGNCNHARDRESIDVDVTPYLHTGLNYITLVSYNIEGGARVKVRYNITKYTSISEPYPDENKEFFDEFYNLLFEKQPEFINSGTFGVVVRPWRNVMLDEDEDYSPGLIIGNHYKTTQFCSLQQASKQLMQMETHNAYVKVYAAKDICDCEVIPAAVRPEDTIRNATCSDGLPCDNLDELVGYAGGYVCDPECDRNKCICKPCTEYDKLSGNCDPYCADGELCTMPEGTTGDYSGYRCPERCARQSVCARRLCINMSDTYSCTIILPEGEVLTGPNGSVSDLQWYDADLVASLPPDKRCCLVDPQSGELFTYVKKRFYTPANPYIVFPKYGDEFTDCGVLPKTNPVNNCSDAVNTPWRTGEMVCR